MQKAKKRTMKRNGRRVTSTSFITRQVAKTIRIPFNCICTFTFSAATTVSSPVNPNLDALIGNIATNFEFYRYTNLMFRALPNGSSYNFTYYATNESTSVADSYATIALAGLNRAMSANMTMPVSLTVPKNVLYQSPEDWYSCQSGAQDYQQGRFVMATPTTSTITITVQVMGIVEFKLPSPNATDLNISIPGSIYTNVHQLSTQVPTVKQVYLTTSNQSVALNNRPAVDKVST